VENAQSNFYRTYLQNSVPLGFYSDCNMPPPVRTADQGYVFSFHAWSPGLHNYNALDYYLFKTDSNFVPQWKKNYSTKAIPLPTGGIILFWSVNFVGMNGTQYSIIEKVTASGQPVWSKMINSDTRLNEGVRYNDKVRLVGGALAIVSQIPFTQYSNYPYTIEIDTLGNVISQQVFSHSLGSYTEFRGIKRDIAGNFYVLGGWNYMVMAKFSPSFNPIWAKYHLQNNQQLYLTDEDILPNGQIVCTGEQQSQGALLMRLDSMGNILDQKIFPNTTGITGLCKLINGNYAVGIRKGQDSLCLFEMNTAFSISNFRYAGKGVKLGTPVINQGTLYFMRFVKSPVLIKNSNNLTNCIPQAPYTLHSSTLQLSSFLLTPAGYTAAITNYTNSPILPQFYVDSCKCAAGITGNTISCANSQGNVNLLSYGPVSWFSGPSGGNPLATGQNYTYTSPGPGTLTVFAEDGSCLSQGRIPVTITVQSQPSIAISSSTNGACEGSAITLTAQGATSYTWNNGQQGPVQIYSLFSSNNSYTVNGKGSNGCPGTQTISLLVYPNPTLNISASTMSICMSQTAFLMVSGANTYTWNNYYVDSLITVSPVTSQQYTVLGVSSLGCASSQTVNITVHANPTVNITGNSGTICIGETATLAANGAQSYTWNSGQSGSLISVFPQQSYFYIVTGFNYMGCHSQAGYWIYLDPCTNLQEELNESSISVYPNPTKDLIYFKAPANNEYELFLFSIQGQLVFDAVLKNGDALNLSIYPNGVYYAQIRLDSMLHTVKIVKQ